jgi:predicted PurR-regulated permease PerM
MIWRLIVSVSIPLLIGAAGCLPFPAALPNHQSRLLGDAGVMVMAAREVPLAPSTADRTRRARLFEAAREQGVPLAAILTSVAVVVGLYLVGKLAYRLRDILLILLMAGFVAVVLNPLVVVLQRVGISRRGDAVAVVTVLAVLAFAGLAVAFGSPLITGVTHLPHGLPAYVAQAQHGKGWIGHLVRRYHIEAWVQKNAPKLAGVGSSLARPALTLGRGAVTLMITLLTIFVLVVLFLLEGPKFRTSALRMMSPERAARYARVAGEVSRSVAGYVLGDLMTSLIAGTVVLLTLAVLGVPFAFLWGLWVALVDFLPEIGGALAGIPTVLFAATHSITAGIVTLVVFLVYTQFENHVLNPVIMSRTVKVNPLLVLVSILVAASIGSWIGGTFGGFVAALLAIPVASSIQVIVREVWTATAPVDHRELER